MSKFHITITDLEGGTTLFDSDSDCIIGGAGVMTDKDSKCTALAFVKCDLMTIIKTTEAAEVAMQETRQNVPAEAIEKELKNAVDELIKGLKAKESEDGAED